MQPGAPGTADQPGGYPREAVQDGGAAGRDRVARFAVGPREQQFGDPGRRPGSRRATVRGGLWAALRARPALLVLLPAIVVVDTVYRQQYSTLPVFLADHGIGTGVYGLVLAVNGGAILLLELPASVALRNRAPLRIIGTGLLLVGAGFAALAAGASVGTAVVLILLVTAGEILYKTPATAYVADSAPQEFQGRFQSLYTGASTSGTVLAPPLGGALYQSAPGLLWPLCAGFAAPTAAVPPEANCGQRHRNRAQRTAASGAPDRSSPRRLRSTPSSSAARPWRSASSRSPPPRPRRTGRRSRNRRCPGSVRRSSPSPGR